MRCEICEARSANQIHHEFPNTKGNRKKYGVNLINRKENLKWSCSDCNSSHAKARNIKEREFCRRVGILECRFCVHDFGGSCLHSSKQDAESCRRYDFWRDNYNKIKKEEE